MPIDSSVPDPATDQPRAASQWSWPNFTRNAAIISGAVALLVWFIVEGVVPNVWPKNFGEVEPGRVYRSGELTPAALRNVVKDHGIRTIIDFGAHDKDPDGEVREQRVAEALGVRRVVLPLIGDGRGDPNQYVEALRIMNDPESQPVLVHCAAGAQRTGCAIALYRGVVSGWDDERALTEAEEFRHDPRKNPHVRGMYFTWRDEIERALHTGDRIEADGTDEYPNE